MSPMDAPTEGFTGAPNELESHWMPFTPNRSFKLAPRLISGAKNMHYYSTDGRQVLDAVAGMWCCNAGHCREPIVKAIQAQAAQLDYAPAFQFGHPKIFELASRISLLAPGDLDYVLFGNSGSEAVDTSLKVALAYHRLKGEGSKTRFIGRERGYHGVGFGGISVGGMMPNRKMFGAMLSGVDHLQATYNRDEQAFSRGEPEWGAHLADELLRLIALHDASTIAAIIVEPVAGSTGVLAPPKGYLKRLREITEQHGILLIFDEVICGFGRLGAPFAAERFDIVPDMITFAKGLTSGTVPMSGVVVRKGIYDTFMQGPEHLPEFFHGYTYSGHPLAAAAGLAALDLYREEGLFERVNQIESLWADAIHSLKSAPHVADIRTIGLVAGIDLAPKEGAPGTRGYEAMIRAFHDHDMVIRTTADTVALSPPLIIEEAQIAEIVERMTSVLADLS